MSAGNEMDFTYGMDDRNALPFTATVKRMCPMDPLFSTDEGRVRKEFVYLFENATMLESMLVSINHMMVDVCHYKYGITGFRKNIISFPQSQIHYGKFKAAMSNIHVGDIVDVQRKVVQYAKLG